MHRQPLWMTTFRAVAWTLRPFEMVPTSLGNMQTGQLDQMTVIAPGCHKVIEVRSGTELVPGGRRIWGGGASGRTSVPT